MAWKPGCSFMARAMVNANNLFPKALSKAELRGLYMHMYVCINIFYVCGYIFPPLSVHFQGGEGFVSLVVWNPVQVSTARFCFFGFVPFHMDFLMNISHRVIYCPLERMASQYLEAFLASLFQ